MVFTSILEKGKNFGRANLSSNKTQFKYATLDGADGDSTNDQLLIKGATDGLLKGANLRAPTQNLEASEVMVMTFVGNGNEWTLIDKLSSNRDAFNEGEGNPVFSKFNEAYSTAPVLLEQYGTSVTPQSIPGAIAKTNSHNSEKVSGIRKSIIEVLKKTTPDVSAKPAAGTTKPSKGGNNILMPEHFGGRKRSTTERFKGKKIRRSIKKLH
jgi:hypothetical protein